MLPCDNLIAIQPTREAFYTISGYARGLYLDARLQILAVNEKPHWSEEALCIRDLILTTQFTFSVKKDLFFRRLFKLRQVYKNFNMAKSISYLQNN